MTPELVSLWHLHGALGDTAETMDVEAAIEEPMTTRLDLADAVQEEADGEQTHDPEMAATVLADQEFAQLLSFGFSAEQAHNVLMLKNWGFATELCAQAVRTCNTYEDALQSLVRDAYAGCRFSSKHICTFILILQMTNISTYHQSINMSAVSTPIFTTEANKFSINIVTCSDVS